MWKYLSVNKRILQEFLWQWSPPIRFVPWTMLFWCFLSKMIYIFLLEIALCYSDNFEQEKKEKKYMKYCLWGDEVFILELLSIVGFISSVNFYVYSVIMCKITGEKPRSLEHVCYNFLLMTPWSCCCYIIGKRCLSFSVLFNITTPMKETEWCLFGFFLKLVQDTMYKKSEILHVYIQLSQWLTLLRNKTW